MLTLSSKRVTDPLISVTDPRRRDQLTLYRQMEGDIIEASELEKIVQGWGSQTGIFQPKKTGYALWIRQTLGSPYSDKDPVPSPDGSWTYAYSPQGVNLAEGERRRANDYLENSQRAGLPVGVFREIKVPGNRTTYKVWGLARVVGKEGDHYILRGEAFDPGTDPLAPESAVPFEPYEPELLPLDDIRRKRRNKLFPEWIKQIYHERCSLCDLGYHVRGRPTGVDAAHIVSVEWKSAEGKPGNSGDLRNGLLLCKNHHALFDSYGWTLESDYSVRLADDKTLRASAAMNHILELEGKRLRNLPDLEAEWPAQRAIQIRKDMFEDYWG